jgi:hypothetical protein
VKGANNKSIMLLLSLAGDTREARGRRECREGRDGCKGSRHAIALARAAVLFAVLLLALAISPLAAQSQYGSVRPLFFDASPKVALASQPAGSSSESADGETSGASLSSDDSGLSLADASSSSNAASSAADARMAALEGDDESGLTQSELDAMGGDEGFLPTDIDATQVTYTTISRLAEVDEDLDGKLVTFIGEVIGEPVTTSDGSKWVQLRSSSGSAILVSMDSEMAEMIKNYGSYSVKGSTLRVTGIYRVADPDNLGSLDVTAYSVSLVDAGGAQTEEVNHTMLVVAIVALAVALALFGVKIYLRMRNR